MLQIAVLQPQRQLAEELMTWLHQAGHSYTCCSNTAEFIACLGQNDHDLLLVDVGDEAESALEKIADSSIQNDHRIPLLFISEVDAEQQIVTALAHGADDYIVKPLNAEQLISRIHVLVRRLVGADVGDKFRDYGPYRIDFVERAIHRDGERITLTDKDFNLAEFLFNHQNQLLSRHRLLSEVWGLNQAVNTRTVDMHISRLRKSLLLAGTGFEIQTVHQHGYRLMNDLGGAE